MYEFSKYIGLDVHKDTISVSYKEPFGDETRYYGKIRNTLPAIKKMIDKLNPDGEVLSFCYEAGPCGYVLHRQLTDMAHECIVVAPSLIYKKRGNRIKNDKRDSLMLAEQLQAGLLTSVWVPTPEHEAIRDLTRAREDFKELEKKSKQKLNGFLLRHGKTFDKTKSKWTLAHFRWLEKVKFENPYQQIVLEEYINVVIHLGTIEKSLKDEMRKALETWEWRPLVEGLMALRGVEMISAMTIVAEIGDLTRFQTATQLMAYLGLMPSENSSGQTVKKGGITKTGNSHARRILVESACTYRFPARKTAIIKRRGEKCSQNIQDISWKAQKRMCGRFRHLRDRNKKSVVVHAAIARELAGFIWAIGQEVIQHEMRQK